jgi:uncharacterized membrane protein YqiK
MTGADAIAILILLTIVVAVVVYLLHWLYRHSSKDQSFVRTGSGGERVVMGGGALVIPIIHDITVVNMNAIPVEIRRQGEQSLITREKLRVDIVAEFFVRVMASEEGVSTAARTLGARTQDPMALKEIVQGRFVDAMSAVAATMTMEEMHSDRLGYIRQVAELAGGTLGPNGLELENASLTALNQTDIAVFNPANAFDAEGLTRLTEEIEERRKARNRIENEARIDIKRRDFEAESRALEIDRDLEYARIDQARAIEIRKAAQAAEIEAERSASAIAVTQAKVKAEEEGERIRIVKDEAVEAERIRATKTIELLEVERARDVRVQNEQAAAEEERAAIAKRHTVEVDRIRKDEEVAQAEIAKQQKVRLAETVSRRKVEDAVIVADREIEELRIAASKYIDRFVIEQDLEIEIADKARLIAVTNKAIEEAVAKANEAEARKALAAVEEQVATVRAAEAAERARKVDLIAAETAAEREALRVVKAAEAEKAAVEQKALAEIAEAKAAVVRYETDAEGARKLNDAENMRTDESRRSAIYEHLVKTLPQIIRETVKPMENIESIKILQVDGLPGLNSPSDGGAAAGGGGGGGNISDQVVNSAMKYRTQVAFVDGLMEEIGLPLKNLGSAGGMSFRNFPGAPAPKSGKDDD